MFVVESTTLSQMLKDLIQSSSNFHFILAAAMTTKRQKAVLEIIFQLSSIYHIPIILPSPRYRVMI